MNIKAIPIQGLELDKSLELYFTGMQPMLSYKPKTGIILAPRSEFEAFIKEKQIDIMCQYKISTYDSIAVFNNQIHSVAEVLNLKIAISILYFAYRWECSHDIFDKSLDEYKSKVNIVENGVINKDALDNLKKLENGEFYEVIGPHMGFFSKHDEILYSTWDIKLGKNNIDNDDFDMFVTKIYSGDLFELYEKQQGFEPLNVNIKVTEELCNRIGLITAKLNKGDEYSGKLRSVLRIFYGLLPEDDIDTNIILYSTILETLLLGKDEDCQRKKVSARSACIVGDQLSLEKKKYIADLIYYFYKYRNQIVHDGKSFLELDQDIILRDILSKVRTIIYILIKKIILFDITKSNEIIDIVKRSACGDGLKDGFDYIDINSKVIPIIEP